MASPPPPYLVRTSELPLSALGHRTHPIDSSNHRYSLSLGDTTGLTRLGVHLCRLPPGATSTTLHYHTRDDEWYYIIDAGAGDAVLLTWEPATGDKGAAQQEPREETIKAGDFFGFKAGEKHARAHALRAGAEEVVYLVGGSREASDQSVYPLLKTRLLIERSEEGIKTLAVDDKDLRPVYMQPPTVADK